MPDIPQRGAPLLFPSCASELLFEMRQVRDLALGEDLRHHVLLLREEDPYFLPSFSMPKPGQTIENGLSNNHGAKSECFDYHSGLTPTLSQ